jgi:hypothetical protein
MLSLGRLLTPHPLPRSGHTHASHLLAAAVNVSVVSGRLEHAWVGFALDTCAQVMPGQQKEAAAVHALLESSVTNL